MTKYLFSDKSELWTRFTNANCISKLTVANWKELVNDNCSKYIFGNKASLVLESGGFNIQSSFFHKHENLQHGKVYPFMQNVSTMLQNYLWPRNSCTKCGSTIPTRQVFPSEKNVSYLHNCNGPHFTRLERWDTCRTFA